MKVTMLIEKDFETIQCTKCKEFFILIKVFPEFEDMWEATRMEYCPECGEKQ